MPLAPRIDKGPYLQIAALPVMRAEDGTLRILLVTSRETRRWIIPKGWPMKKLPDHEAASKEAREEAGVVGTVGREPVGVYLYWKRRVAHFDLCRVSVYLLAVERQLKKWREKGQRESAWFSVDQAANLVDEPGLSDLIRRLPSLLPG